MYTSREMLEFKILIYEHITWLCAAAYAACLKMGSER